MLDFFFNLFFSLPLVLFSRQILGRASLTFEVGGIMVHLANNHNVEKYWKIFLNNTARTTNFLMTSEKKILILPLQLLTLFSALSVLRLA